MVLSYLYMKNPSGKKNLNKKQLDSLFEKVETAPVFDGSGDKVAKNITEQWVIVGGDSRFDNRLVTVSTWLTGQVS